MLLKRISHSGCFGSLFQFFGTHDLGEESLWDLRPSSHRIAPLLTATTPAKFRENRSYRFHLLISGRTKIPLHFAPLKALGWFLMSQLRKRKEPCGRQAGLTARFSGKQNQCACKIMYNAQRSEQHFLLAHALLGVHGVQEGVLFFKIFLLSALYNISSYHKKSIPVRHQFA